MTETTPTTVAIALTTRNLYAAANAADIRFDNHGETFLRTVHDILFDTILAAEDPAAAWQGILDDEGYGPDHDDLTDATLTMAYDAVGRLTTYDDIILSWAGVNGWAWEPEVLAEGLIDPGATTLERMRPTLVHIAEAFLRATYVELRKPDPAR